MNKYDKISLYGLIILIASIVIVEATGIFYFSVLFPVGAFGIIYGTWKNVCIEMESEER